MTTQTPRPEPVTVQPDNIPAALKDRDQWITWKWQWKPQKGDKPGKWDKPPYRADRKGNASSTEPATWTTFDNALAAYQAGGFDGIGFVLTDDDPFVMVDLDKCLDEQWALDMMANLDSYSEGTPSGKGYRTIVDAEKPEQMGCSTSSFHEGHVEVYQNGRYMTVTGNHIAGTPKEINYRQNELAFVCAPLMKQAKQKSTATGSSGSYDMLSDNYPPARPERIREVLAYIPNHGEGCPYEDSFNPSYMGVMMGVHNETNGTGFDQFRDWSAQSAKHDEQEDRRKWQSLKPGAGITFGSVVKWAQNNGMPRKETPPQPPKKDDLYQAKDRGFLVLHDTFKKTLIGKLTVRAAHCLEFPEVSTALSLLTCASAAASMAYAVQYRTGTSINPGLYSVVEQPPSTSKSHKLKVGTGAYLKAVSEHNKRIHAENDRRAKAKEESFLGKTFTVATDATSAAMDEALSGLAEGRFFVASAEQSAFDSLFPKETHASNNELLLKGWQGEFVAGMRKGRKAFTGEAFGAVMVIAQPGSAERVFNASNGTGLAERFLYVSEPTLLGSRTLHGDFLRHDDKAAFNKAVAGCVKKYSDRYIETMEAQEPDTVEQLHLTDDGYQLLLNERRRIEPTLGRLNKEGRLVEVGWLGKIETHVLKVAATLHVFEAIGNGSNPPATIPAKQVETALEFIHLLAAHLFDVLQDSGQSGEIAEVDAVQEALMSTSKPHTVRSLAQALRKRNPFRAMHKAGYQAARQRVEAMIKESRLMLNKDGKVETL